ncbi:hypothetical protein [Pseudomonas sp. TCU-HL1]|uniref:hypothetical protein n=1 Tax=Pseudomonas sp. TCU-HL1 TaxID=1856685 RepID=UPI00083D1BAB|nr:hypothetical protein [Pseudomonas sp. TCU-HL1]AOE86752.1 hypothetical protein THL1_4204 [Pseudomonas sp. TCU-HL1]
MNLVIQGVYEAGVLEKEHVFFKATEELELSDYLVADHTYDAKGNLSDKHRHTFWFPSRIVKKGEFVALRTGSGTPRKYTKDNGQVVHRFYWNLKATVWNETGDAAALYKVGTPSVKRVPAKG